LKPGDTTATGQKLGADTSAVEVLKEAVRRTSFKRKRAKLAGSGRGIGLALFYHGAGFTGSGEVMLGSRAGLETTPSGVRILVANTEIGQGTRTMLSQIVADATGVAYENVDIAQADTSVVPDSGPTVASRTCMVVGGLLERCARKLLEQLNGLSPAEHHARHGRLHVEEQYEAPPGREWDDKTYRGDAYATYAWGCDVAELAVDPVTHEVSVAKFTAVQEFGRPIHPRWRRARSRAARRRAWAGRCSSTW
jgi:CO/xanthine dehydrogenase Mo-binding subunit